MMADVLGTRNGDDFDPKVLTWMTPEIMIRKKLRGNGVVEVFAGGAGADAIVVLIVVGLHRRSRRN
eukprot:563342-Hanusia_phi.AAC.1